MKSTILYTLLLLLPVSLLAAEQITIEAKFIESSKEAIPHDLAKLAQAKGIDLLSAPRATTKSGQQAQIEVTREHQPASVAPSAFKPVPIGITVRVTPQLEGERIAFTAQLTVSELVTSKASDGQTRSEITSRDLYVSGTPKDDEEVWFDFTESNGKKIVVWLHFKHKVA
ncbi:MAG: type II and III secretion system protein [Verrucomicrobia bacterium]|nr:type II and III secretion system protein [Verrucomicrobiota bacterium]